MKVVADLEWWRDLVLHCAGAGLFGLLHELFWLVLDLDGKAKFSSALCGMSVHQIHCDDSFSM